MIEIEYPGEIVSPVTTDVPSKVCLLPGAGPMMIEIVERHRS